MTRAFFFYFLLGRDEVATTLLKDTHMYIYINR